MFDNVSDFFNVQVEAGSTVHDSIENKREEVLGFSNLMINMKGQGVNINIEKVAADVIESFPNRSASDYIMPQPPQPQEPQGGGGKTIPKGVTDQVSNIGQGPGDALTKQIIN